MIVRDEMIIRARGITFGLQVMDSILRLSQTIAFRVQ